MNNALIERLAKCLGVQIEALRELDDGNYIYGIVISSGETRYIEKEFKPMNDAELKWKCFSEIADNKYSLMEHDLGGFMVYRVDVDFRPTGYFTDVFDSKESAVFTAYCDMKENEHN